MNATKSGFFSDTRKLVFIALLLLFGWLLLHRLGQVETLLATLRQGRAEWVAVAVVLQFCTLLNQPALYQSLYQLLDLPIRWREMVPVVWAAHFVNIVTPAAGLGGTALLFDAARRRGFDMGRVTLANTLYFLLNFVWFVLLLGFSLMLLFLWHDLKTYELLVALIPMVGVVLALAALWLVAVRPQLFSNLVQRLAGWFNRVAKRVLRREVLTNESATNFAATFAQAADTLRTARGRLWRPWTHAMLVDGLEIMVLGACFAAFPSTNFHISLPMLIAGYALGTLFLVVSITPQGLGVVEGVMTAIFVSFGVPLERAAVVVLVYRGLSFWLPLVIGFGALRWTPALRADKAGMRR